MATDYDKVNILLSHLKEKGIDSVVKEFSLGVKYHKKYPNVFQLCYNFVEADFANPIPQVCRGIVMEKNNNDFKVVALPYTKFFNFGESQAEKINWDKAKVYEKLDGSIMTMYWYDDAWHLASKSLPDGGGRVVGYTKLHGKHDRDIILPTYCEEFWRKENNYALPTDKSHCYMFEVLLSKYKVVVHPPKDRVVLHGVRNMTTLEEIDPVTVAKEHEWDCVQVQPLTSLKEVIDQASTLKPHEAEGFVVCDDEFRRVKVKSPQYVAIALLCDTSQVSATRRMLPVVMANEDSEFLSYFPMMNELFVQIKTNFDEMVAHHQKSMDDLKEYWDDGRKFAIEAKKIDPNPWYLFECRKHEEKIMRRVFTNAEVKNVEIALGKFLASRKKCINVNS